MRIIKRIIIIRIREFWVIQSCRRQYNNPALAKGLQAYPKLLVLEQVQATLRHLSQGLTLPALRALCMR
jgi:hypothetical protein